MGRPRNFESPEKLIEVWDEFKKDLKEQSKDWLKVQYVGKEGERVADAQKLPMTLEGFKRFCRNQGYGEVNHYFDNSNKNYEDFCVICSHIREEIRENQIIGGMLGFFNPSITQRLNGLTDKTDNTTTIKLGKEIEEIYE